MIDKQIALSLSHGTTLYSGLQRGSDNRPTRCRVNGKCKTWKRKPTEWKLPVKRGLYEFFYLVDDEFSLYWYVNEDDAIAQLDNQIVKVESTIVADYTSLQRRRISRIVPMESGE